MADVYKGINKDSAIRIKEPSDEFKLALIIGINTYFEIVDENNKGVGRTDFDDFFGEMWGV